MRFSLILVLFLANFCFCNADKSHELNIQLSAKLSEMVAKDTSKTVDLELYYSIVEYIKNKKLDEIDSLFNRNKLAKKEITYKKKSNVKFYISNRIREIFFFPQKNIITDFGIDSLDYNDQTIVLAGLSARLEKLSPLQIISFTNESEYDKCDYKLTFSKIRCGFVQVKIYNLIKVPMLQSDSLSNNFGRTSSKHPIIYLFKVDEEANLVCLHRYF